jgi:hypothetical protein
MLGQARYPLEPEYCLAHGQYAPCMACLAPSVAQKILGEHVKPDGYISSGGFFFVDLDLNDN